MTYGENIKYLRRQRGYTQQGLADATGISQSLISSWELGIREPSYEMLKRVAQFFSVPISNLISETHADQETVQAIADSLHHNPDLRLLFDKTRKMSKSDIKAVLSVVNAITKERDGE